MRSLSLNTIGIDTWPVGLGTQPLLDTIDLRNNQITVFPESIIAPPAEQLERTARVNNFTLIGGNPLSEVAQQQLSAYWARLERELPDLWGGQTTGGVRVSSPCSARGARETGCSGSTTSGVSAMGQRPVR